MARKSKLDQTADKSKSEQTTKENRKPPYTDEQMDEALKTVYRTGKQQDGANYLQINKGTFSKKKREIEEKEPERVERLKAEVEAEQDTPQNTERKEETEKITVTIMESAKQEQKVIPDKVVEAPQMPQIAPETQEPIKSTLAEEKAKEKPNTKQRKQVFSFRAAISDIAVWRAYATATGMSLEKFANAALQKYVENHPLTGTEQVIFEALKERNSR